MHRDLSRRSHRLFGFLVRAFLGLCRPDVLDRLPLAGLRLSLNFLDSSYDLREELLGVDRAIEARRDYSGKNKAVVRLC